MIINMIITLHPRYVGAAARSVLHQLEAEVGRINMTHCIGHSLGAHVCGFLGKYRQVPVIIYFRLSKK